ncbi:pentatricopeptide repeat protein [Paecilomyces variotii No. 5]|uniref:Pentatricopeptide repeat protein n=1 Tax=Byssochlamys spectabilis (strain No. 5 / NBRC 109023) TaxID=1356009 RepID=V5FSJ5_BYSSN|nr:pentatricopeptide repeat protein [Paecilomyces variotii No. 5]
MLRQAIQGARWSQHAIPRSLLISSNLPPRRTFSGAAWRFLRNDDSKDKVRFFEQDTRASKRRVEVDPEAEESVEAEEVQSELSKLEQELQALEEGPYGPNSEFMKKLPERDRLIALRALREYEARKGPNQHESKAGLAEVFDEELDAMLKEEFEGLAKEEEEDWDPTKPIEQQQRLPFKEAPGTSLDAGHHPYVSRFNESLKGLSKDNPNDNHKQEDLWKWYRRCKQTLPSFLASMPEETMAALWETQSRSEIANTTRVQRLQLLVEDLASAGRKPTTQQILVYIESLHEHGNTNEALELWRAHQTDIDQGREALEGYWTLGVRLLSAQDDPQKAQDMALAFLANDRSRQPRILIPVIDAWGRQPGEAAAVKAWALYLQLKTFLGPDMTMEDYDTISVGFLKSNRLDIALAVFKDMMVTGRYPDNDSTALYKAAVGLVGNLQTSSISEEEVNKVSLSALTILPRAFQNRFFYGSWMKKLIGMGEVDSAALVVELMYERGVKPDPKHLNGIIGAWLREGNTNARDKAERLGWTMIQRRIDMVWARTYPEKSPNDSSKPSVYKGSETARIPRFMRRTVPPATIETFCLLLLHYTRRGDEDMIRYLTKCLRDARIRPNSYFMNHLLYDELRRQDIRTLWVKYKEMSTHVRPDLETFACLWDCAKLQYDRFKDPNTGFPPARGLYAEMMRWYAQLTPHWQNVAREEFSKDLYDQITRCFCLSRDIHGTLVALHSMRDTFGFFPDDDTAHMLVLQVARMAGVPTGTPRRRLRRLSDNPRNKENIAHVRRLLEILSERKISALRTQGLNVEQLEITEKQQLQLEIMAELLRVVISRAEPNSTPAQIEDKLAAVAAEMSVPKIDLGSPLTGDALVL